MRRMPWVTCLWPGLPELWMRGSWPALSVAAAAAALLNAALLATFGWSELIAPDLRTALWVVLGAAWLISAILSLVWTRRQESRRCDDRFGEAIEHYVKGDWFQAQRVLSDLLRREPRDVDARLMLATLLRHTGRLDEAIAELELLSRCEDAPKWDLEIRRERELLAEAATRRLQKTSSGDDTDRPSQTSYAA